MVLDREALTLVSLKEVGRGTLCTVGAPAGEQTAQSDGTILEALGSYQGQWRWVLL